MVVLSTEEVSGELGFKWVLSFELKCFICFNSFISLDCNLE